MKWKILPMVAIVGASARVATAIVNRLSRQRRVQSERAAVQTWEGEGGNITGEEPGPDPVPRRG